MNCSNQFQFFSYTYNLCLNIINNNNNSRLIKIKNQIIFRPILNLKIINNKKYLFDFDNPILIIFKPTILIL